MEKQFHAKNTLRGWGVIKVASEASQQPKDKTTRALPNPVNVLLVRAHTSRYSRGVTYTTSPGDNLSSRSEFDITHYRAK